MGICYEKQSLQFLTVAQHIDISFLYEFDILTFLVKVINSSFH